MPTDFACVEYGTFSPKPEAPVDPSVLIAASMKVEQDYLPKFEDSRGHAIAKVDETVYSEIAFARTLGAARVICGGYLDDPACADLLGLFDPDTTDLDFWYVLA